MPKTTADLVANIRRRAMLSQDLGQALSDADILAFASDELQNVLAPKIYATRGWHYSVQKTIALTANRSYRLPNRCSASTIITVELTDTPLNRFLNYVHPLQVKANGEAYYIYANNIVLSPAVASSGSMVIRYMIPPSQLYLLGNSVTGVSGSRTLLLGETPNVNIPITSPFTTGFVDIYSALSPYEMIAVDIPVNATGTSPNSIVTVAAIYSDPFPYMVNPESVLADFAGKPCRVADAGFSDRPMLPDELHDLLAHRTAMRCMEAIGHSEDLGIMGQKLVDLEHSFLQAISPRERGDFKVIQTEDFYYDRRF